MHVGALDVKQNRQK